LARSRDHLGLLCDVGELAARLAGSSDIQSFLDQLVRMIARHLLSNVCSIYLYDEDAGELVLRATCGLAPDSVGRVRLKPEEGLTGKVFREQRAICEQHASLNPDFKGFNGINEELYESFMAVPVCKGMEKIGVLVAQREEKNSFAQDDVKALRAIASQVASAIENARMLISLGLGESARPAPVVEPPTRVRGDVASRGLACGPAAVLDPAGRKLSFTADYSGNYSLADFELALEKTENQLAALQEKAGERLPESASLIFDAHLMMLKDSAFVGGMRKRIENGESPPAAVLALGRHYIDLLSANPHAYIREKAHDVEDLLRRLLGNLTGAESELDVGGEGCVVIARDLYPSEMLKIALANVGAIVLVNGGVTSHVAILARSLRVPMVIADDASLLLVLEHAPVLVDAETGEVLINPPEEALRSFRERQAARETLDAVAEETERKSFTKDGTQVKLLANINLLSDLELASRVKAEGIGLYRSEFPFLIRDVMPSEEEQFVLYGKLLENRPEGTVTFRTLDLGSDKLLSYFDEVREENPALGLRSIRFSLKYPDAFRQQLRAILRAGCELPELRIMFPLVASLEDFRQAREILRQCIEELRVEETECHQSPLVGVMIEVPAAVALVDALADEADFLCIGTNDLIQYLLAVDRGNEKVAGYFLPHHPAVLRTLKRVAEAGLAHGREVSVCGEMAHEEKYLKFLLGAGIRTLSIDSQYRPALQKKISTLELAECQRTAELMLEQKTLAGVEELL
jgi:phosphotransferase system enzyme I (PtsP)